MAFPVTEDRLLAAEKDLGRRLPRELRARLLLNNGGEVGCVDDVWQLHPVWDDTNRRTIARTTNHVVHETEEARRRSQFPESAIAIGHDGSGDLLVVRGASDIVELWSHETGECEPVTVAWDMPTAGGTKE